MMNFDEARDAFSGAVEEAMVEILQGDGVLYEAARYHMDTGGKRIRALLPPWLAHNLGAEDMALGIRLGAALELMHNGTLVHDDLQDGDRVRRGQDTVWARYGLPQAINVGTALMLWGLAEILDSEVGRVLTADANHTILRIVEGQALEFQLHAEPEPTLAHWYRMADGKTGALFGTCFLAGARAAGLDEARVRHFEQVGREIGLFFQMQDDLLDVVGDKGRAHQASDIAEGKISWPVAWVCEHAPEVRGELLQILRTPRQQTSLEMVERAVALLHESGAIQACIDAIEKAKDKLSASNVVEFIPGLLPMIVKPIAHVLTGAPSSS